MGLTYRGKHSLRDFGMQTKITDLPITPPKKTDYEEDIPYRDGSIDFSESGGRVFYKDKTIEVEFYLICNDTAKRNKTIEQFVTWINGGKGELILDDMPFTKWIASPITVEDMTIMLQRAGKTVVAFRCEPFNQLLYDTQGIPLGADIPLGTEIEIGWPINHIYEIANGTNTFKLNNAGNAAVRPKLVFNGNFTSVSFTCGGNTIKYNHKTTQFTIDCELFSCFEGDTNTSEYSNGDYIEIGQGENEIKIQSNGTGKVEIIYNPLFYYTQSIL